MKIRKPRKYYNKPTTQEAHWPDLIQIQYYHIMEIFASQVIFLVNLKAFICKLQEKRDAKFKFDLNF